MKTWGQRGCDRVAPQRCSAHRRCSCRYAGTAVRDDKRTTIQSTAALALSLLAGAFRGDRRLAAFPLAQAGAQGRHLLRGEHCPAAAEERRQLVGGEAGDAAGVVLRGSQIRVGFDQGAVLVALAGVSMPNFWLGLLLIMVFAVNLRWLPAGGFVSPMVDPMATLAHLVLPAITLGTAYAATITRMLRASMVDVLQRDYILVARAMGLRERRIVWHDATRNALIPTVTVAGFAFGYMLAGTIIVEVIFNIPGVGRLLYESILTRDYPVVQGIVLFNVAIFVIVNFAVDLIYTMLDPRIRY